MEPSFRWTDERRALWARFELELDQRRDPLADAGLAAALAADPELQRSADALLSRLQQVGGGEAAPTGQVQSAPRAPLHGPTKPQPPGPRTSPLPRAAAAAACLLVVAGGIAALAAALRQRPTAPEAPQVTLIVEKQRPAAPTGRTVVLQSQSVLNWTLESHTP